MPSVDAGGAEIYYETTGDGDPLVMIMGLGADSRGWAIQQSVLAENHRLVLIDNRGIGKSSIPPAPYTTKQMALDTLAVMDDAGVEHAHILGVSLGGAIAQELVLAAPERVRSLALGSTWPGPSEWRSRIRRVQLGILESEGVEALVRFRALFIFSPAFLTAAPAMMNIIEKTMAETPLEGYLYQLDAAETHDARARLGVITSPTLVLTGKRDILVPPELSQEVSRLIPGAELDVFETAHAIQLEEAQRFNETVLAFFARH
jgi:pimeloyl-ACP methyl ester carboxylesterase